MPVTAGSAPVRPGMRSISRARVDSIAPTTIVLPTKCRSSLSCYQYYNCNEMSQVVESSSFMYLKAVEVTISLEDMG